MVDENRMKTMLQGDTAFSMLLERYGVEKVKGKAAQLGLTLDNEHSLRVSLKALATEDQMFAEALQDIADDKVGVKISVGDDDLSGAHA